MYNKKQLEQIMKLALKEEWHYTQLSMKEEDNKLKELYDKRATEMNTLYYDTFELLEKIK